MLTSHFTEQTSKNPVCSLNLTHFTMTMHATIHFSPCNIMRLASTHMINRVKTTCRKEEHHCESATERGRSGFGSFSVTSPFSAWLKTQSFSAAQFSSREKGDKHLLLAVPSGSSTPPPATQCLPSPLPPPIIPPALCLSYPGQLFTFHLPLSKL